MVAEDGTQLGVMPTRDAMALAREQDLDLVEVAPNSVPPVCRLLDYGKFRYLQSTKEREMRKGQKSHGMREVRFRPKIGQHDIDFKARLVKRLLGEGNKVKVSVMFRGREIAHPEIAVNLLRQVHDGLKDESKLEQAPNLEGRFMSIVLAPATAPSKPSEPAPAAPTAAATAEKAQPARAAPRLPEPEPAAATPVAVAEPEAVVAETTEPEAAAEPAAAVAEPATAAEPAEAAAKPAKAAAKKAPAKAAAKKA